MHMLLYYILYYTLYYTQSQRIMVSEYIRTSIIDQIDDGWSMPGLERIKW